MSQDSKVLVYHPNVSSAKELRIQISQEINCKVDICVNKLEAYKLLSQHNYENVVLNFETPNENSLELLKFIRLNSNDRKVIFLCKSSRDLSESFSEDKLAELGVSSVFYKTEGFNRLLDIIKAQKNKFSIEEPILKNEKREPSFTRVSRKFLSRKNPSFFDLYVKINNHYIKILKRGDIFEDEQFEKYSEIEDFFISRDDEINYVKHLNNVIEKLNQEKKMSPKLRKSATCLIREAAESLFNSAFCSRLEPRLLDECRTLCYNVKNYIEESSSLKNLFNTHYSAENTVKEHSFLTMIYSIAISIKTPWINERVLRNISLASLFHDLGLKRLDFEVNQYNFNKLSMEQLIEYKKHPEYSVEMLNEAEDQPEALKQIIFQHHEYMNGEGFPLGLYESQIYPPARVLSMANFFADKIILNQESPEVVLRGLIKNRINLEKFDINVVKALVDCFKAR